ncbi:hypothetical protein JCM19235_6015 [Vibrio maritimus]|uniref:Uncharacterized protein n=1 Tax=Vibrio maritimus TaxID=990268 RepID=A0A090RQE4_9VIBR|nr:hypothetical protein JCM19235_6015 [Vibrio maritimus]
MRVFPMSAKKALKKLKKKVNKSTKNKSLKQLQSLKAVVGGKKEISRTSERLGDEILGVANEAAMSALSELAAPLTPVLSWLNGGQGTNWSPSQTSISSLPQNKRSANDGAPKINSIAYLPLKSPPCKRCPALSNGICKCAAKKFKLTA